MCVNVVFVVRCLYSAVSLTLVREQRFLLLPLLLFIIIIYRLVSALSTDGTASGHVRRLFGGHWVLVVPV